MGYTPEIKNKISTLNSTAMTTVAAGQVYQGTGEDVSKYGRVGVSIWTPFGEPTDGTLTIEISRDGVNWGGPTRDFAATNTSQPHMWQIVEKYFRIKYTNGSTSASTMQIQTQYSVNADIILGHQLDEVPLPEHEATLTKAIIWGVQPSGLYKPDPQNGVAISTTSTLTSGQTFTSDWIDTHGYNVIESFINSDVPSSGCGVVFEFTDDLVGQTVRSSQDFTFSDDDIFDGFKNIFLQPKMVGFRVKYINGVTNQSSFILQTDLKTNGSLTARLDQTLEGIEDVTLTRNVTEFDLDAARRHISGQRAFFFFGFNGAVGTTYEDVHPSGGDINWQISASTVEVLSSSAADTSDGLGVQSVEIHGLSATGEDQDEIIIMSGTTPSLSTLSYIRVNKLHSEECGTYGGSHQGNITCQVAGGGDVLSLMTGFEGAADSSVQFGSGEAFNGYWSVPVGKVMYITRLEAISDISGAKTYDIALYESENILDATGPSFAPRRVLFSRTGLQDPIEKVFKSHIKIKSLTDIWFRAKGSATSKIDVSLDFYLVDADAGGA